MKFADRIGFYFSDPVIHWYYKEPLGFFPSPLFSGSIGIILRPANLVVMDCLPIAVGAMSFFIYMQRRNQTGFQGPSLSRRKLSQNLPPDPWVLLFSGSIDMCIQGSHWQRAKNRIILCLVRSVELNVEFSLSEVHENEMMWVNMGVEWKFFNSSDKKGRKGNQQCRITVIF